MSSERLRVIKVGLL